MQYYRNTMDPDGNTITILWKYNVSRWKYKYIFTEIQCVRMEIQIQYYRNTMYPDGNTNSMYPDGNTNTLLHKYNVSGWKYKYKITEIQYIPLEIQMQCILIRYEKILVVKYKHHR